MPIRVLALSEVPRLSLGTVSDSRTVEGRMAMDRVLPADDRGGNAAALCHKQDNRLSPILWVASGGTGGWHRRLACVGLGGLRRFGTDAPFTSPSGALALCQKIEGKLLEIRSDFIRLKKGKQIQPILLLDVVRVEKKSLSKARRAAYIVAATAAGVGFIPLLVAAEIFGAS